ncbi:PIN domain-containing protein [Clavibacter michiganensis]|nr:PIN domain-containing protein [Clavibacter michiganensis]
MKMNVVVWKADLPDAQVQFDAVLAIHKANRARLGPMPDTGFRDRAKHGGLLVGVIDDAIAGYVLYDVPRSNLIKLVHVCVGNQARGTGLARVMVNTAITRHPRRTFITASCRTDYGIDGFWQSLGMYVASERAGRALTGSVLMNWVKRIHVEEGLDLLETATLSSNLPLAVLDTNVINDLFLPSDTRRAHREESSQLEADWLQPLITFAVSGEVDNEISKNKDQTARQYVRAATQHLTRLSTLRPDNRGVEDNLLAATDRQLLIKDPSLKKDVLHIADAIHAGADYFVTNDGNVITAAQGWALGEQGIRIVRPHQLIAALSPTSFLTDFRSHLIDDGDLEWCAVFDVEPELEPAFRAYSAETKPEVFARRLRELLAKRQTTTVQKLVDSQGGLWALAAWELDGLTLRLPMIRSVRGERGSTVAFQLLRHFRREAWEHGATRVEVSDSGVTDTLDAALLADGFSAAKPRAAVLGPASADAAALAVTSPGEIRVAERNRWPLVVRDAGLETYVIPIQPRWATHLLGLNDGLISLRRRGLGLSRDLVYFSGTRIVPSNLPARILWYATSDLKSEHVIRRIVARSLLVDSVRLPVEEALSRFSKIGVLRRSEIEAAADKSGIVNVIRFEDTELLQRSISRHDEVFESHIKGIVHSMRRVSPKMFDEVMSIQIKEGRTK